MNIIILHGHASTSRADWLALDKIYHVVKDYCQIGSDFDKVLHMLKLQTCMYETYTNNQPKNLQNQRLLYNCVCYVV